MTRVQVNGDRLSPNEVRAGTNGSYHESLSFDFSGEWSGLQKKAVFYPARGKPVEKMLTGESVKIPGEVMRYSGTAKYIISGYVTEDGNIVEKIITLPAVIEVDATLDDKGGEVYPPTATSYEQLHNAMKGDIAEAIESAITNDPTRFKGNPGEAATITVSGTKTLEPGNLADVVGEPAPDDPQKLRLTFKIPRGDTGDSGVRLLGEGESIEDADIPEDVSVVIVPTGESLEIVDGKDGTNFKIIEAYPDEDTLNEKVPFPNIGDMYGVGEPENYYVYAWVGEGRWANLGRINGVEGKPGADGRGVDSIVLKDGDGTADSPYIFWIRYTDGVQSEFPVALTNGKDGRGISSVSLVDNTTGVSGKPGTTDTYEINYTDGTTFRFIVYNGKDGDGADITVSDTVTADGTDAVSGKAVYDHIASVIGDFDAEAAEMDALIGGAV